MQHDSHITLRAQMEAEIRSALNVLIQEARG